MSWKLTSDVRRLIASDMSAVNDWMPMLREAVGNITSRIDTGGTTSNIAFYIGTELAKHDDGLEKLIKFVELLHEELADQNKQPARDGSGRTALEHLRGLGQSSQHTTSSTSQTTHNTQSSSTWKVVDDEPKQEEHKEAKTPQQPRSPIQPIQSQSRSTDSSSWQSRSNNSQNKQRSSSTSNSFERARYYSVKDDHKQHLAINGAKLIQLYDDPQSIAHLMQDSGVDTSHVYLGDSTNNIWSNFIYGNNGDLPEGGKVVYSDGNYLPGIVSVIKSAKREYPNQSFSGLRDLENADNWAQIHHERSNNRGNTSGRY